MLKSVLRELEAAKQPMNLSELSQRLGIERAALDGMVQTLVRMGRLWDDREAATGCGVHCAGCTSAAHGSPARFSRECAGLEQMPRTYSVVKAVNEDTPECQ